MLNAESCVASGARSFAKLLPNAALTAAGPASSESGWSEEEWRGSRGTLRGDTDKEDDSTAADAAARRACQSEGGPAGGAEGTLLLEVARREASPLPRPSGEVLGGWSAGPLSGEDSSEERSRVKVLAVGRGPGSAWGGEDREGVVWGDAGPGGSII